MPRDPAPPYAGEGPHAIWHFSEDPDLSHFVPHIPATSPDNQPLVWGVDTRHAPMFWFPRDCPRGCVWPGPTTTDDDRAAFFGHSAATRIHVIQSDWYAAVRDCTLFAYRLPSTTFVPHDVGGYWVSDQPVDAIERVALTDLIGMHADAGIELRITPSLKAFWDAVVPSTLEFSGSRLANLG